MMIRAALLALAAASLTVATAFANSPSVKLDSFGPNAFEVETGSFHVKYDATKDDALNVFRVGNPAVVFHVSAAPGKGLYPLDHTLEKTLDKSEDKDGIVLTISSKRNAADFKTTVRFPRAHPGLINWKVQVFTKKMVAFNQTDYDVTVDKEAVDIEDLGDTNPAQVPLVYFYEAKSDATCLFYSDYTSLNDYFNLTQTRPAYCTGLSIKTRTYMNFHTLDPSRIGIGYYRPASSQMIPAGVRFLVTNSWCYLTDGKPADESAMCDRFIRCLADIYPYMTKPKTVYTDWPAIARHEIADLQSPQCWTRPIKGREHLLPYTNDTNKGADDLRTELQILAPLTTLNKISPTAESLAFQKRLIGNIKAYYVPQTHMIENMITGPRAESVQDSFYPAINGIMWGKVILHGVDDPELKKMFVDYVDKTIEVGRAIHYKFAWQVDWEKKRIVNDSFWEYDVGGALAYMYLQCYQITGNKKYLDEAKRAVESLRGHGFELPHEIDTTAAGAAACAWLYHITGDSKYLDLGRIPLANVFRRCWFWESNYGYGKYYKNFFAVSFSKGGPQIAPLEQMGAWEFLREYYRYTRSELPPGYSLLLTEFYKWNLTVMRYFYPPLVNRDAVAPGPASWPTSPNLYITMEDMNDGHTRLGTVGQGIYMSRAALELAGDVYEHFPDGTVLYSEYPLLNSDFDAKTGVLRFAVGGNAEGSCSVRVTFASAPRDNLTAFTLKDGTPDGLVDMTAASDGDVVTMEVPGGSEVLLSPDVDVLAKLLDRRAASPGLPAFSGDPARFSAWLVAFNKKTSVQPESDAIERIVDLLTRRILGVNFTLDPVRNEVAPGDSVAMRVAFSSPPGVEIKDLSSVLHLPLSWRTEKSGPVARVEAPKDAAPGTHEILRASMRATIAGAPVTLEDAAPIAVVEPVEVSLESLSGESATAGKQFVARLRITNNRASARSFDLDWKTPQNWALGAKPAQTVTVPALRSRNIELALTPDPNAALGADQIEASVKDGDVIRSRSMVVDLLKTEGPFIDRGGDASAWKRAPGRPDIPVVSRDGHLVFGPRDSGWGLRQREIAIDLDRYPILSIKVDHSGALWALFLDDGRHIPELGLRIQEENAGTGIYHYDLRKSTGWKGVKKFELRLVLSINAPGKTDSVDWIAIDSAPLTSEPPTPH